MMITPELKESLDRYALLHCPTGDFLKAVLSNDLMTAMARADMNNRYLMFDICGYIYNELPRNCWGSRKVVEEWIQEGVDKRRAAE